MAGFFALRAVLGGGPGTIVQSTTASFSADLSAAVNGTTLVLAAGDYSGVMNSISSKNKGAGRGVTIYGTQGATTTYISVSSSSGLIFRFVDVVNSTPGQVPSQTVLFFQSTDCTLDGCTVFGIGDRRRGVFVRLSNRIKVTNNVLTEVGEGLVAGYGPDGALDSLTFKNNSISGYGDNAIFMSTINNLICSYNKVTNLDGSIAGHCDTGQYTGCGSSSAMNLWDAATGRYWSVIAEKNYAEVLDGQTATVVQGQPFTEFMTAFLARQNVSFGTQSNGIALSQCTDSTADTNYLQGSSANPNGNNNPITIRSASVNCVASNNTSSGSTIYNADPAGPCVGCSITNDTAISPVANTNNWSAGMAAFIKAHGIPYFVDRT